MFRKLKYLRQDIGWRVDSIRRAVHLAKHGWSHTDAYAGFDHSFIPRIADFLDFYADITHGWPGETSPYGTFEEYQAKLRSVATALRAEDPPLPQEWLDFCEQHGHDALSTPQPPEVKAAMDRCWAERDRVRNEQRQAMHWLADNYGGLWD